MISALETALCLARDLEGNAGETVRTSRRTHNINWNATPERLFLKCVLGALIRKGLPKGDLLAKFKKLVPDYQHFFDSPPSDSALWGRADTGRRGGKYRGENPDVHPLTLPYWPIAVAAVEANQPLTADAVRKLVHVDEQDAEQEAGDQSAKDEPASDSEECAPDAGITDQDMKILEINERRAERAPLNPIRTMSNPVTVRRISEGQLKKIDAPMSRPTIQPELAPLYDAILAANSAMSAPMGN